jgi:endonuclease/exonuclease/phosphatase family metal-dependent hydrolase
MPNPGRTLLKAAAPALTCALVVSMTSGAPASAVTARTPHAASVTADSVAKSRSVDVRVASFNVQSVGVDKTAGNRLPWKQRRGTVMSEILREHVDVIGLQEVNPSNTFSRRLVDGSNQMFDLRNGLNKRGGHFALNSNAAVDCLNATTGYHCRARSRGASGSERILYNTQKLTLLRRGFVKYSHQSATSKGMGLAWVVLRSKVNGHAFLFTSTHLDPPNRTVRVAQWRQLIANVRRLRGNLPVVSVGDFNTQKFDAITKSMLPAMHRAGFGDVLNQQYRVNPSRGVRAEKRINGWINSNNRESRNVRSYSYPSNHAKTGNSIDYIFASNRLRVKEFKLVLNFNSRTLRVTGTIASDHNMLRATVVLP